MQHLKENKTKKEKKRKEQAIFIFCFPVLMFLHKPFHSRPFIRGPSCLSIGGLSNRITAHETSARWRRSASSEGKQQQRLIKRVQATSAATV